jgi:hypothetical protein
VTQRGSVTGRGCEGEGRTFYAFAGHMATRLQQPSLLLLHRLEEVGYAEMERIHRFCIAWGHGPPGGILKAVAKHGIKAMRVLDRAHAL